MRLLQSFGPASIALPFEAGAYLKKAKSEIPMTSTSNGKRFIGNSEVYDKRHKTEVKRLFTLNYS